MVFPSIEFLTASPRPNARDPSFLRRALPAEPAGPEVQVLSLVLEARREDSRLDAGLRAEKLRIVAPHLFRGFARPGAARGVRQPLIGAAQGVHFVIVAAGGEVFEHTQKLIVPGPAHDLDVARFGLR